jgi:hypothetical protein
MFCELQFGRKPISLVTVPPILVFRLKLGSQMRLFMELKRAPRSQDWPLLIVDRFWSFDAHPMLSSVQGRIGPSLHVIMEGNRQNAPVDHSSVEEPIEEVTFSIDLLLERVNEFQRRAELDTIESLRKENEQLRERITHLEKIWSLIATLLREPYEAVVILQGILERSHYEKAAAEQDWLAFWGIKHESGQELGHESQEPST